MHETEEQLREEVKRRLEELEELKNKLNAQLDRARKEEEADRDKRELQEVLELLGKGGDPAYRRFRILSLDGGGLYGLNTVLWLRWLCEKNKDFLNGEDVHLFAGCSAGAVNALLLAKHKKPRDALLSGELEDFWIGDGPGPFSNSNRLDVALSYLGLAPWYSDEDCLIRLRNYFGEMKLGELEQKVHITTFNWAGTPTSETVPESSQTPDRPSALRNALLAMVPQPMASVDWILGRGGSRPGQEASIDWMAGASREKIARHREVGSTERQRQVDPDTYNSRAGQSNPYWRPKYFHNLHSDDEAQDSRWPVVCVAYGAVSPPGFRPILWGLGDGASFSANPTVSAVAAVVRVANELREELGVNGEDKGADSGADAFHKALANPLERIAVLSVGVGQRLPSFFMQHSNLGALPFSLIPSNPLNGVPFSPATFMLDPDAAEGDFITKRLLTRGRALRLNPAVLTLPTANAAYLCRNPVVRRMIVRHIYETSRHPNAERAIQATLDYLRSPSGWLGGEEQRHGPDRRERLRDN